MNVFSVPAIILGKCLRVAHKKCIADLSQISDHLGTFSGIFLRFYPPLATLLCQKQFAISHRVYRFLRGHRGFLRSLLLLQDWRRSSRLVCGLTSEVYGNKMTFFTSGAEKRKNPYPPVFTAALKIFPLALTARP